MEFVPEHPYGSSLLDGGVFATVTEDEIAAVTPRLDEEAARFAALEARLNAGLTSARFWMLSREEQGEAPGDRVLHDLIYRWSDFGRDAGRHAALAFVFEGKKNTAAAVETFQYRAYHRANVLVHGQGAHQPSARAIRSAAPLLQRARLLSDSADSARAHAQRNWSSAVEYFSLALTGQGLSLHQGPVILEAFRSKDAHQQLEEVRRLLRTEFDQQFTRGYESVADDFTSERLFKASFDGWTEDPSEPVEVNDAAARAEIETYRDVCVYSQEGGRRRHAAVLVALTRRDLVTTNSAVDAPSSIDRRLLARALSVPELPYHYDRLVPIIPPRLLHTLQDESTLR